MKLPRQTVRILGIDPGSRITGFGVIEVCGQQNTHIHSGCIKTGSDADLASRLKAIYDELSAIVADYRPAEVAIEKVFMNKNADSALKLGQARGAAIVAAMQEHIQLFEYTPNRIKQAIVGRGHADKPQVQHMIRILLNLPQKPQPDQADALAVALCHGHSRQMLALTDKLARFG